MNGDPLLVQMLHEARLRDAAERRQHTERRRLAMAANRRRRRELRGTTERSEAGRSRVRPRLRVRSRLLAWVSLHLARR